MAKLLAEDPDYLARQRRREMPAWARARVLVLQRLRRGKTNWAKVSRASSRVAIIQQHAENT